ncbi:MAG: GDSL-type esterase/lipase family protein [Oceanicoccus sp.]
MKQVIYLGSRLLLVAMLVVTTVNSFAVENERGANYPDPERFRGAIDAFVAGELENPSPDGGIVATGSSSMRGWHPRIAEDLEPLTIIPRGFGGSNMYDVLYFLDDLVLRYKPRAVMLYEGDNDAFLGASSAQVLDYFDAIVERVHMTLPETRIYVLAVKPSISRWDIWPSMQETNVLLKSRCDENPLLIYVDVATPMFGADDKPIVDIFLADMLHMKDGGYDIWRNAVRPILMSGEAQYE